MSKATPRLARWVITGDLRINHPTYFLRIPKVKVSKREIVLGLLYLLVQATVFATGFTIFWLMLAGGIK